VAEAVCYAALRWAVLLVLVNDALQRTIMLNRFRARGLSIFLALLGCSSGVGEGHGSRSGASGSAGVTGLAGGSAGSAAGASANGAGSAGSAGAVAGSPSSPRAGAGGSGSAGSTAGGAASSAGAVGGSLSAGASGNGGSGGAGPAPTFTQIYDTIIVPSCGGTQCHLKRPTPYGYDFSSKSAASTSWRSDVFPGDAANSPMFQVLDFGIMPKGKPPLSIAQLYLVYDWINAGALDN
jgi:hypothetical protein